MLHTWWRPVRPSMPVTLGLAPDANSFFTAHKPKETSVNIRLWNRMFRKRLVLLCGSVGNFIPLQQQMNSEKQLQLDKIRTNYKITMIFLQDCLYCMPVSMQPLQLWQITCCQNLKHTGWPNIVWHSPAKGNNANVPDLWYSYTQMDTASAFTRYAHH